MDYSISMLHLFLLNTEITLVNQISKKVSGFSQRMCFSKERHQFCWTSIRGTRVGHFLLPSLIFYVIQIYLYNGNLWLVNFIHSEAEQIIWGEEISGKISLWLNCPVFAPMPGKCG